MLIPDIASPFHPEFGISALPAPIEPPAQSQDPDPATGSPSSLCAVIPAECHGWRLDKALVSLFPDYSRSRLQRWIRDGQVAVDNRPVYLIRQSVQKGALIIIQLPKPPDHGPMAEAIDLDIVHEDEAIIVLNKPAGLVVHPGAGRPRHTLYNALLHHDPCLAALPRAGLIHRLDKDTTGLLVVARSEQSYGCLSRQMRQRRIRRTYLAVVDGCLKHGGVADFSIGRHRRHRVRMAVMNTGRHAKTFYRVVERFRAHTLISVRLETGRTHQIRVHTAHMGHPVTGDPVYGRQRVLHRSTPELATRLKSWRRQALHACELSFNHPLTTEEIHWDRPPPPDMRKLLTALRADASDTTDY